MIEVRKTIAPVKELYFTDLMSFETCNYYGIWDHAKATYLMLRKHNDEFWSEYLPPCESLTELADIVEGLTGESIIGVSESQEFRFEIVDESEG